MHDRVICLRHSRDFHDLETASISQLFHVPSHLNCFELFRKAFPARILTHGTCFQETFLQIWLLQEVYATSPTAAHGELVLSSTGKLVARL